MRKENSSAVFAAFRGGRYGGKWRISLLDTYAFRNDIPFSFWVRNIICITTTWAYNNLGNNSVLSHPFLVLTISVRPNLSVSNDIFRNLNVEISQPQYTTAGGEGQTYIPRCGMHAVWTMAGGFWNCSEARHVPNFPHEVLSWFVSVKWLNERTLIGIIGVQVHIPICGVRITAAWGYTEWHVRTSAQPRWAWQTFVSVALLSHQLPTVHEREQRRNLRTMSDLLIAGRIQ
jgi:hypothetical protein